MKAQVVLFALMALVGCSERETSERADGGASCELPFASGLSLTPAALRIHEVVSSNDGVFVDELGETDDYLEIENTSGAPLSLSGFTLTDAAGNRAPLPELVVPAGGVALLWADGDVVQGPAHLPLKLDADGELLTLWADPCTAVDRVEVPALAPNDSFGRGPDGLFARCRYASPERRNDGCTAPAIPELRDDVQFAPYTWPEQLALPPLTINELALRPAAFVELVNTTDRELVLSDYSLRIAAIAPHQSAPLSAEGSALLLPSTTVAPHGRAIVPVRPEDLRELAASPDFEGWATLYDPQQVAIDRVPFMSWPEGAVLARMPDQSGRMRFCASGSPGVINSCTSVAQRTLGDRAHALYTEGDFAALAAGGTALGVSAVKFVVDMQAGDLVHLLSAERWALHYTFYRERVAREPPLDRCDAVQAEQFNAGWYAFSAREYDRVEGRRFLLGTLLRHNNGLQTVEFAPGDAIDAPHIRRAFYAAISATPDPRAWSLRPTDAALLLELRKLEGTLPIVSPSAAYTGISYQPLTRAESFGVLRFVAASELERATLSADTIVVTDDVPNDVPFVGGLITESFQTPLSHVNVLSQARGTPNMAVRRARDDPRIAPLLGKLVRLEVLADTFTLREATREEVDTFWAARRPTGPRIVPPADLGERQLLILRGRGLADGPAIGAKAAQFAELYRVPSTCEGFRFDVPDKAFAIPVAHYADHFRASGAAELLRSARADPGFRSDPAARERALAGVRSAIAAHPIDPALLSAITKMVAAKFGARRVRFRSSSNVEDLPTFNGAGLHTSTSAELDDPQRSVALALYTVWSSLWLLRAYDEREDANIEQEAALMGVLVHEAYGGEAAQGVAISRDLLDVTRDDIYYINAQRGEAAVTNPAPGVTTEQLLFSLGRRDVSYRTRSSLTRGEPVLSPGQTLDLACALHAVHAYFRPLLDPMQQNRLFAMQIEYKFERDGALVVKQARPQPFGHVELPADCR